MPAAKMNSVLRVKKQKTGRKDAQLLPHAHWFGNRGQWTIPKYVMQWWGPRVLLRLFARWIFA
jgi:hypothetical protein